MTPYYQRPDIALYVADAVELCHAYAGQAQLVVTSPPYNIARNYQSGDGDRLPLADYLEQVRAWIAAMATALRPGGVLALNVPCAIGTAETRSGQFAQARHWRGRLSKRAVHGRIHPTFSTYPVGAWVELAVIDAGLLPRRSVTWVKSPEDGIAYASTLAMGNMANVFLRPSSERIVLASKDRYQRSGTTGRVIPRELVDIVKDTWHVSVCSGHRADWHPCPFPEEIPRRLMRLFTEPGDLVVDPFLGSGTTAVVARELGRRCVGGDLSETYIQGCIERLEIGLRASAQMRRGQLPLELLEVLAP